MVDAVTGGTELVATKMDLIAAAVQRELAFRAKLLPTVRDVSQFAEPGLKTIEFPKLSSFSVTKRVEGSPGDSTVLTATTDIMALDENAYIAWIIDSTSKLQSRVNAQVEFAQRAAAAHGRGVDLDLITAIEAGAGLDIGSVIDVTRDDILQMIEYVEGNDGILEDSVFTVAVDQKIALLKIAEFSQNDIYGSPVIMTGQIGTLYGVPVVVHNGMGAGKVNLYEKSAVAIGFQAGANLSEQGANEYGTNAVRVAMDQLYGIKVLQDNEKAAGVGKSPLIAKLR